MNTIKTIIAKLYTAFLKQAVARTVMYEIIVTVLGTAVAFACYWMVGLLAGGIIKGAIWICGVGFFVTMASGAWKMKTFHTWKVAMNEMSQTVMNAAVVCALIAVPAVVTLVICHFVSVAIMHFMHDRFNKMALTAMGFGHIL